MPVVIKRFFYDNKPVMYRFKWIDADHYILEIHDLGIVQGNTNVIQVNNERVK